MKFATILLLLCPFVCAGQMWNTYDTIRFPSGGVRIIKTTRPTVLSRYTNDLSFVTSSGARASISLTTTGAGGFAAYAAGVLNVPLIPTNTNQLTNGSSFITRASLSAGLGITYNNSTGVIAMSKRREPYSGTTNSSGVYTVTYSTAFGAIPNVQLQMNGGSNKQTVLLTSSTVNGFSCLVQLRADVLGLLPTYSNVTGQQVDVLVTEY